MDFIVVYTDKGKDYLSTNNLNKKDISDAINQMIEKQKIHKLGLNEFIYPFSKDNLKYSIYGKIENKEELMTVTIEMIATEVNIEKNNDMDDLQELSKKPLEELTVGQMLKLKKAGKLNN